MLMPRKVKHRKQHRGRMKGDAKGGTELSFGEYGIQALEPGWITARQIEAARIAMTRHIKRGGKVWINVFPDKPVTEKPAETRMGSGKGNPERWVAVVKPGRVLFELSYPNDDGRPRRPSSGPSRSCRSRPGSSPVRRRSDWPKHDRRARRARHHRARRRAGRGQGRSCSTCASSTSPASSTTRRGCSDVRARRSPASTPMLREREIAAAEARGDEVMADEQRRRRPTSRNARKVREGVVVSNEMDKTAVVAVDRPRAPPAYAKFVQRTKKLYVHDEANDLNVGDRVRVMETRPLSKLKRWRVVEVLERATE